MYGVLNQVVDCCCKTSSKDPRGLKIKCYLFVHYVADFAKKYTMDGWMDGWKETVV